jgi:hypothetical protein
MEQNTRQSDILTRTSIEPDNFLTLSEIHTLRDLIRFLDGRSQMLRSEEGSEGTGNNDNLRQLLYTDDQRAVVKKLLSYHGERTCVNTGRKAA